LRAIARMDWDSFVEHQSAMDAVLRKDPIYSDMTFATRDRYRHVVERIAKRTRRDEAAVAGQALDLAAQAPSDGAEAQRQQHVGYYLVDQGRTALEDITGYSPTFLERLHRWILRHPNAVFVGGMALGTVLALAALLWLAGMELHTATVILVIVLAF